MATSSLSPGYHPFNVLELLCIIEVSAGQARPQQRGQVCILLLALFARYLNAKLEERAEGLSPH